MRNKFEQANQSANKAEREINTTISKTDARVQKAMQEITRRITPMVRGFLVQNYNKSGVKTRTGKLLKALQRTEVKINIFGRKPKLTIHMPAGVDKYKDGSDFYEASAAVNYGAIRNVAEGNKKRRKNLKKKAQKKINRKKSGGDVIGQGHILKDANKTKGGSLKFEGGVVVTKGFNFFELTSSQQSQINDEIIRIFNRVVFEK